MIYDSFTFFNELDLLEIRLNQMDKVVDKFVLVEGTKTFQGKDKPLHFQENKERFSRFLDRIIHVVVDNYPQTSISWEYEYHQRNMILEGLKNCSKDDVILISDLDEIPDPEKVRQYVNHKGLRIFRQRTFYYFLNCIKKSDLESKNGGFTWNGTVMVNYSDLTKPQELRELSMQMLRLYHKRFANRTFWKIYFGLKNFFSGNKIVWVNEGGWHFSFLGGVDQIIRKLEAFAHTEYNNQQYKSPEKIKEAITQGKDIFGRGFEYSVVKLDQTFPSYILQNKEKYSHLLTGEEVRQ